MSCSLFSNLTICCLKALSHSRRLWWDNEPKQKEFQSVSPNKNHSSLFLHLRFYRLNQWVLIIELWAWLRAVTSQPQEVLTARSGYSLQCRPLNFRQNQTGCRSFIRFLTGKQMSVWWTSAVGPPEASAAPRQLLVSVTVMYFVIRDVCWYVWISQGTVEYLQVDFHIILSMNQPER